MVNAHDHRPCGEEQQRLEESVRHQMKHRHRIGRCAQRDGHVAKLRQRGIGDDALDVVLDDAQKAHEQRGDGADGHDQVQRRVRQLEQRRHARDHEYAGRDHGRGMDQRRNRCRALHRVGQPDMQRELRALAHRADKQAYADHGDQHPVGSGKAELCELAGLGEHLGVVQRTAVGQQQTDAQDEAEISDPVDQEGLHVGENRTRLIEPKADQQIGNQADRLPAEEQLQQVVAHHEHQHRKGEQRYVGEKAVVALVLVHVANGVDVNHQRHEADDAHHHRGEPVNQETHFHFQAAYHHPGVDGLVKTCTFHRDAPQRRRRQDEGQQYAGDGQRVAHAPAEHIAAKRRSQHAGGHGADQRRQRDAQQTGSRKGLAHRVVQPFSVLSSSTLMLDLLRNNWTSIARPIADSAAATVRMKKTNIWPRMSPR